MLNSLFVKYQEKRYIVQSTKYIAIISESK